METPIQTLQNHTKLQGKYTIIGVLGKGGFGITYLAIHDNLHKKVAIKELFMSTSTMYCTRNEADTRSVMPHFSGFETFKTKFLDEARTLAKFTGKKGIVQISDTFEENNTSYFVMDYIDGKSLKTILEEQGTLSEKQTTEYALQILNALSEVHKENILHRDLKPDNLILRTADKQMMLIDFGIAREYAEDETKTQTAMMTVGFAPPEQKLLKAKRGAYTDLYSVGAVLYYCLTHQRPQTTDEISMDGYLSAKTINPAISVAMNDLIDKALTKPSAGRFQTCEEMMTALQNLQGMSQKDDKKDEDDTIIDGEVLPNPIPKPRPIVKPAEQKSNRTPVYIGVGVVVLLVLGLVLWQPWAKKAETNVQISATTETPTFNYEMVYVEGGSYKMGCDDRRDSNRGSNINNDEKISLFKQHKSNKDTSNCKNDEKPLHFVQVGSFSTGRYEVTQAQWRVIMGNNPSNFKNCENCPVENVSWNDIQEFLKKLNQKFPLVGVKGAYRLLTEEEWEYAARGGNQSKGYQYAGSNSIDSVAWYKGSSSPKTHPVGQKSPNELGIYDMTGNVWEWTASGWSDNYKEPRTFETYVLRGGSWVNGDGVSRIAYRNSYHPDGRNYHYGFRLCVSQ